MANKIVLISDDSDFFEFIKLKLELRKSDKLFAFKFDDVPANLVFLENALLIINSEGEKEKTLDLLKLFHGTPIIVVAYNDDEIYKRKCYRAGALDFVSLLTTDTEFRARILPALNIASLIEKNLQYRKILVKNKIISDNNEVYIDYEKVIDLTLDEIKNSGRNAVFMAIEPDKKGKFLIKPNYIETVLLANIRKNDILMNYAPDKYYLLMLDTNKESAKKFWENISIKFSQKIYAGIVSVKNQTGIQLINTALNKLHEAMHSSSGDIEYCMNLNSADEISPYNNFKLYRKEFKQKMEKIISPVFYSIRQKYTNKLTGVKFEVANRDGYGEMNVTGKHYSSSFKISSPGFSKIHIDISLKTDSGKIDSKRITFEPDEMEAGLLTDLLEQFMSEIKNQGGL